jgi:hypothetical protein
MVLAGNKGGALHALSLAHRLDESPVGYSLAGCAPAGPASALPTAINLQPSNLFGNHLPANGNLSLISLSHLRGALQLFVSKLGASPVQVRLTIAW